MNLSIPIFVAALAIQGAQESSFHPLKPEQPTKLAPFTTQMKLHFLASKGIKGVTEQQVSTTPTVLDMAHLKSSDGKAVLAAFGPAGFNGVFRGVTLYPPAKDPCWISANLLGLNATETHLVVFYCNAAAGTVVHVRSSGGQTVDMKLGGGPTTIPYLVTGVKDSAYVSLELRSADPPNTLQVQQITVQKIG